MAAPVIDLAADGLSADGVPLPFPYPIATLVGLWGEPDRWESPVNDILVWHDLGIYAHVADADHTKTVCLRLVPRPDGPGFTPRSVYTGSLHVDGDDVRDRARPASGRRETVLAHDVKLHLAYDGEDLESVEITSAHRTRPPEPPAPPREDDETRRAKGEPLTFTDLNLKLAVIDALMYQQEVVRPRFELAGFARSYDGRPIDLRQEWGAPIAEALDWFARLEIDAETAAQLHELVVDAGNEVYHQVAPGWDGEDDTFDVRSWEDLALLPNLTRLDFISLTPDAATVRALRERGLEVDA